MATRRGVLKIIGGGVIAAAGGAGAFLATRSPHAALAPWREAGRRRGDVRLDILSWAILAPNPHNRQPWLVRLDGDDGFALFAEPARKLPHTDPFDRQITIGLGCFLEVARMAAGAAGYRLDLTPFPDGEPAPLLDGRPVAHARLVRDAAPADPLFAHVPARRSCKAPFDLHRPITATEVAALADALPGGAGFEAATAPARVARLRELAYRGHELEMMTPHTNLESVELMRIGRAEIEASPDGIDLGGPFLETLNRLGMLDRAQLADQRSSAFRQGLDMYRAMFAATPAFVWLATPGNSRRDQLDTGSAWLRLNLAATGLGLGLHPVSQTLQEYPEMAQLHAAMHAELVGGSGRRVQMLGRLGAGPTTEPSPRWPLSTRLTTT